MRPCIVATDGVNTGLAVSEPFRLPPHVPRAHIINPRDDAQYHHSDQIRLAGRGYDAEERNLSSSALSWSVTGLGTVGTGSEVVLNGLEPGDYAVTLRATDALNNTASARGEVPDPAASGGR